jgi:DNA polymerase III subunit alpha
MCEFVHLHCHTQFSLLDGASSIEDMLDKALADGQKGVALTDHGNMFGAFKFVREAEKRNLKPIIGCEFYLVEDRHKRSFTAGLRDQRYHQLLLAKNRRGYENLSKLCSLGYIEGLYGKYPRIDKEILERYSEGLIATSCCIGAEIPQAILQGREEEAEEMLKWWLERFGEDYYIEIMRHKGLENITIRDQEGRVVPSGYSQERVNQILLGFAEKYNIKVIATNDSHYVNEEDWVAHDILLCVNTGSKVSDPKGEGRGQRFAFSSSDYFFKTHSEMSRLFKDLPMAIENTMEIYDKVDKIGLSRDILLPSFPLPANFTNQDHYLRHLTYEGAQRRYGSLTEAVKERLDFELDVIEKSGYPGYFLIVQDFTRTARELGVAVGPGRGSAAGSAVAYCLGITNIDPIKYDLLFERFLNPERVSMPDIDIDFDDEGRQKVIDYVIDKYGKNQVAQIITYGTMAAKSSFRDVGRVLDLPLSEVDRVTKAFPSNLSTSLKGMLAEGGISKDLKEKFNPDDMMKAEQVRQWSEGQDLLGETLRTAKKLEGSIRNTGIHACGVIITPDDITKFVPVSVAKDSDMLVSQFDNSLVEEAGLLKMDFLGLKTLSIIKDAMANIKKSKKITFDIEAIPLDDPKTYQLFQKGETAAIFQYESAGMQKYLKDLKPTRFEDLIAMNALYRPGPLQYIPEFIDRKHGRKPILYDLPEAEEYLAETYGITVYQEQVMLLSQKLAGFTKGQADSLRKGMGKKNRSIIDGLFPLFIEGGTHKGHPEAVLKKIWQDWEAFASYAFNKSHSTCYAYVAYQTAYLKANYPAEFMASTLTHNKSDIGKINFLLRECKRMALKVLPPDVNESGHNFTVTAEGKIRIGLTAIKGVGEGPVDAIVEEREKGLFTSLLDLSQRIAGKNVNKKSFEALIYAGGFDGFGLKRAQYFEPSGEYSTYYEHLMKLGQRIQQEKSQAQVSLFGAEEIMEITEPSAPEVEEWAEFYKLEKEKEVVGIYVSGHPLDAYALEMDHFTNITLDRLDSESKEDKVYRIGGIITAANHGKDKNGNGYCKVKIQDYKGELELFIAREKYYSFRGYLEVGQIVHMELENKRRYQGGGLFTEVRQISLLSSLAEKHLKGIKIKIGLDQLDEGLLTDLYTLVKQHKGHHTLRLLLVDEQENMDIELEAYASKVEVNSAFVEELNRLSIQYRIN